MERNGTVARIVIERPLERVWWAIAEPEGLRRWLLDAAEFETGGPALAPGDRFAFRAGLLTSQGAVAEVEVPRRLLLDGTYETPLPDRTALRAHLMTTYTLDEVVDGTRLGVTTAGYGDGEGGRLMRDTLALTWRKMLLNLKSVLEFGHDLRPHLFAYPRLGVLHATLHPSRIEETGLREGNYVLAVRPDGPAGAAGLRAGDVIVAMSGQPTPTYEDYVRNLSEHRPGDRVTLDVVRGGQRLRVEVQVPRGPA